MNTDQQEVLVLSTKKEVIEKKHVSKQVLLFTFIHIVAMSHSIQSRGDRNQSPKKVH